MFRLALPLALVLAGAAALASCTGAGNASSRAERPTFNVITAEEINAFLQTRAAASAADIVRQIRPNWLTRRGPGGQVWAYEGGLRVGEANRYLQTVDLHNVARLEYLNANEANLRFGPGHDQGVIQIVYRTR